MAAVGETTGVGAAAEASGRGPERQRPPTPREASLAEGTLCMYIIPDETRDGAGHAGIVAGGLASGQSEEGKAVNLDAAAAVKSDLIISREWKAEIGCCKELNAAGGEKLDILPLPKLGFAEMPLRKMDSLKYHFQPVATSYNAIRDQIALSSVPIFSSNSGYLVFLVLRRDGADGEKAAAARPLAGSGGADGGRNAVAQIGGEGEGSDARVRRAAARMGKRRRRARASGDGGGADREEGKQLHMPSSSHLPSFHHTHASPPP
ncbi:hypothetical protein [Oryza sativa Japonica Group]|uniref:Uncharacterized protein n=1 Tax=Oryza sativa subsp. japonica TaxID=39947 RepID=Q5Z8E2_ORYSJ|nr:hypothetical protein [Oryza sativa Japonica Group]